MSSLFDVGKSALTSYRQSLAVTGQNIANINTEGYKRREAKLEEVTGSQGGVTSLPDQTGLGVRVTDINRSFDQYLLDRARSATGSFEKLDVFVDQLKQLENMLLPDKGNLGAQIASFFDSLREVAASPSDIAPRAVAIEQGKSLAAGFNNYGSQLDQLLANTEAVMEDTVDTINLLSNQLADINGRIMAAGQSGQSPNSIYDLRDKAINDLSKLTDLTVSYSGRGVVSVKLGSSGVGPTIVDGKQTITTGIRKTSSGLQPIIRSGGEDIATNQISSGMAGGLIDANKAIMEALKDINHLAALMSKEMNAQHRQGITLDGQAGENMFSNRTMTLSTGITNRSEVTGEILITDPEVLPLYDLTATYSKEDDIWTVSGDGLSDTLTGARRVTGPGFTLTINGEAAAGDVIHLSPLSGAASGMRFLLEKPQQLAAASGLLIAADSDNLSDADIVVDFVTPTSKKVLPRIDQVLNNSPSPIEASEFRSDGLVAEIPAGSGPVSLSSLTRQASAKFQISDIELSNLTQLNFKLENTTPSGPFTFNVNYNSIFPSATSDSGWSDTKELADMLNNGVIVDSANNTLVDYGLYASGANGTLTLTTSSGDFDGSDAFAPTVSIGSGTIRATVKDSIIASDLQIFTREGRHVAGTIMTNDQLAHIMTAENGFSEHAVYTGDYLNQTKPGYRNMAIDIDRSSGMHSITIGADGSGASAQGSRGGMPATTSTDQTISIALSNGISTSVDLKAGDAASEVAENLNDKLQHLGIKASANMRVELSDLSTAGTLSFFIEGDNRTPIKIQANVVPDDLTNLVTAINDQSNRTGITAALSSNKKRVILEKEDGKDIFVSDYSSNSPQLTAKPINRKGQAAASSILLGGEGSPIDHARFSGLVELDAANSFSLTTQAGIITNSQADTTKNGLVEIESNPSSDKKTIKYSVNSEADRNEASFDGQTAVAAAGSYGLTLPTSDSNISFTAEITSASTTPFTQAIIQKGLVDALRGQAPLASLSGDDAAAKPQSMTYSFTGPTTIDQYLDSMELTVAGTTLTVDMLDGDGLGNHVTTAQQLNDAAARLVNNANLGVTATSFSEVVNSVTVYRLKIEANEVGQSFSMGAVNFVDDSSSSTLSLSSSVTAKSMPQNGQGVYLDFAGETYHVEMLDDELRVSGGEEGRLTAYFDDQKKLQVVAGGTLSGEVITVTSDSKISGNSDNAAIFGLSTTKMRFASTEFMASASLPSLNLTIDGTLHVIAMDSAGALTSSPSLPSGVSISSTVTGSSNGRVVIEYNPAINSILFEQPQNALGMKTADLQLKLEDGHISVGSLQGDVIDVTATASSLVAQTISLNDIAVEDLLVFTSGTGARLINSQYDQVTTETDAFIASALDRGSFTVKAISDDALRYEILDTETGHSIATRTVNESNSLEFDGYQIQLKGKTALNDAFLIQRTESGAGDSRNLDALIAQQSEDINGKSSGGFSDIFSTIVATVGASVRANNQALDGAEATKEAAIEAEAEFSGVNLDAEAAALIEFQQAYQASARVLSTARELFQTLIDVV